MRGVLTSTGAKVSVLSVRAPRSAKITLRCQGKSCPASRWSRSDRKSRLTRMSRFERGLRAGVKITISVTRRGYVGKRTTFVDPPRPGAAALRSLSFGQGPRHAVSGGRMRDRPIAGVLAAIAAAMFVAAFAARRRDPS